MTASRILGPAIGVVVALAGPGAATAQQAAPARAAPDLKCTILVSGDPAGANPVPVGRTAVLGPQVWVHFAVQNQGAGTADGFVSMISITRSGQGLGFEVLHEEQPTQMPLTLGAWQSTTLPPIGIDLEPAVDNEIKARMYADYGNAVAETNEDNWCQLEFTAQGPPAAKPKPPMASGAAPDPSPRTPLAPRQQKADPGPAGGARAKKPGPDPVAPAAAPAETPAVVPAQVALTAPDLSCTVYGSTNEDGTGAIPNGGVSPTLTTGVGPQIHRFVYLHVNVLNQGTAQAAGVVSEATVEENGKLVDEVVTNPLLLGPGLSYKWPIEVELGEIDWGMGSGGLAPPGVSIPITPGPYGIKASVVIDGGHTVAEANETNNTCGTQFTMTAAPQ